MDDSGSDRRMPRVLLVEDEALTGAITAEALADRGFYVQAAADAEDALRYLFTGSPVDILFTGLELRGGIDGAALARLARMLRPSLAVVYAAGAHCKVDRAVPGAVILQKPYLPDAVCAMLARLAADQG